MKRRGLALIVTLVCMLALLAPGQTRAARPDAPRYGLRGPHPVGTREFTIADPVRPLTVTVWYPALNPNNENEVVTYRYGLFERPGRALLNAPPDGANGPYPLIVFSHGLGGLRLQSVTYTEHLASYGFVVIAADHPGSAFADLLSGGRDGVVTSFALRPVEILREIAFVETLNAPGGALDGAVDMNRIGVTGHSFGGYTTFSAAGARLDLRPLKEACANASTDIISCGLVQQAEVVARARGLSEVPAGLWPATTDSRIRAAVALAPSSGPLFGKEGLAALDIPLMVIVGTKDRATPPDENAIPMYEGVSSQQKALVLLENAGHYIYVDKCTPIVIALGRFHQCSDLVWDMDRAHDLIDHFATAFFLATLKDDENAAKMLAESAVSITGVQYRSTIG